MQCGLARSACACAGGWTSAVQSPVPGVAVSKSSGAGSNQAGPCLLLHACKALCTAQPAYELHPSSSLCRARCMQCSELAPFLQGGGSRMSSTQAALQPQQTD